MSGPRVSIANEFVQLVAHVLAHLDIPGPGALLDPRYLAWSAPRMDASTRELLAHDAALISSIWDRDPRSEALHWSFALHEDLASFRASAGRSLAELEPHEVARPALLERLRALPVAELMHATLALVEPSLPSLFAELDANARGVSEAVAHAAAPIADALPNFATRRIELVWALGMHGRGLEPRILVGAPAAWSGCSPARQAVLAAHEHCVLSSPRAAYLESEWHALRTLAAALVDHPHAPTRSAHRDWLAQLDLRELLTACVRAGELHEGLAARLEDEAQARARVLASLAPH